MLPGRAADHSPPSSAAVMEEQSYTSNHTLGHTGPVTGLFYLFFFTYVTSSPQQPFLLHLLLVQISPSALCFKTPLKMATKLLWCPFTRLHGVVFQNMGIFMFSAVRSPNLSFLTLCVWQVLQRLIREVDEVCTSKSAGTKNARKFAFTAAYRGCGCRQVGLFLNPGSRYKRVRKSTNLTYTVFTRVIHALFLTKILYLNYGT